ncbi:MAG TPA: hypothetical protein VIJ54_10670 [Actinomycetes bacterium]
MSTRTEADAGRIRFALTCGAVFAAFAVFGQGVSRWSGVTGVVLSAAFAGWVLLKGRRSREP